MFVLLKLYELNLHFHYCTVFTTWRVFWNRRSDKLTARGEYQRMWNYTYQEKLVKRSFAWYQLLPII